MYFLRIDYIYRGLPVQRVRALVSGYAEARKLLLDYEGDDYLVLQVKFERCVV